MPAWRVEAKHDQLRLSLDATTRRKLERAAAYEETSLGEFVLEQALLAAECVIEVHERVVAAPSDLLAAHAPVKRQRAVGRRPRTGS